MVYIDLFSGCGGLAYGMHKAGWDGLFAIEKSTDAFKTLEHNLMIKNNIFSWVNWLPKTPLDIQNVLSEYSCQLGKLEGKIQMIAGGPPCQGFSMAGKRHEKDERNNLVHAYLRFVEIVNPKVVFFENVKGFTLGFKTKNGTRKKPYAQIVVEKLRHLGYNVHGEIIDFSLYGVPQKRHRFILVGTKEGKGEDFFFALEQKRTEFLYQKGLPTEKPIGVEEALSDLLKKNGTTRETESCRFESGKYGPISSTYQLLMREKVGKKSVPDSHRFANHSTNTKEKFHHILSISKQKGTSKIAAEYLHEEYKTKKRAVYALQACMPSPTLTTLPDDYVHYGEPRILTVREYARLQSFPDHFEFKGKYTTGGKRRKEEVPRYTQVGNAIPPLFSEIAGKCIIKAYFD